MKRFDLAPGLEIGGARPVFIAGPCMAESKELVLEVAEFLAELADRENLALIFKASFDKANRSSLKSVRGPGLEPGLEMLAAAGEATGLPLLTDIHEAGQAAAAAEVVDVIQVPAFLCRQTDLLLACGETGKAINIKKGQFMAPEGMKGAVEKVRSTGNDRVTLTERGASFGYGNLVVDPRGFPIMRGIAPVIYDVTHSLQHPGNLGDSTGGDKSFALPLARAAAGAGVDGFFIEVHPNPDQALSDAATQVDFETFTELVHQAKTVWECCAGLQS